MDRNFGYRKDRDDHGMPDIQDIAHKFKLVTVPKAINYRAQVLKGPGIMDQGQVGSCVGHATCGSCETRLVIAGTPIPHRSPVWIYDVARCIERARICYNTPNNQLPNLEDEGSMPSDAWTGIAKWGVAAYKDRPTSNATANHEPKLGMVESASELILTGAYRIDSTGSSRITAMKTALANGFPIALAVEVDSAFMDWNGTGVISAPRPGDSLGGHYIYVTGYETLLSGGVIFSGPNSWTEDWGDEGFWVGDESFISEARDIYVADVRASV
jgi:hypothetical protein